MPEIKVYPITVGEDVFDDIWINKTNVIKRSAVGYLVDDFSSIAKEYTHISLSFGYSTAKPEIIFELDKVCRARVDDKEVWLIILGDLYDYQNVIGWSREKVADKEFTCSAFEWIDATTFDLSEMTFSDRKLFAKACRSKGKVEVGDTYIKQYSICNGERGIYRALPYIHELNMRNGVYDGVC